MKPTSPRVTPTPSEATLSDPESDAAQPVSDSETNVNIQVDGSALDPGSRSATVDNDGVAIVSAAVVSVPAPVSTGESGASGAHSGFVVGVSSTGKRKEREDDEEDEGNEREKVVERVEHAGATDTDLEVRNGESMPLAKKRRFGSDAEEGQRVEADPILNDVTETSEVEQEGTSARGKRKERDEGEETESDATNNIDSEVKDKPLPLAKKRRVNSDSEGHSDESTVPLFPAAEAQADTATPVPAPTATSNSKVTEALREGASPAPEVNDAPSQDLTLSGSATSATTEATTNANATQPHPTAAKPCPFLTLPLELLAEILILTGSPQYVLATMRTCKALCSTLLGPDAQFIWREVRNGGSGCTFELDVVVFWGMPLGIGPPTPPKKEKRVVKLPDPPKSFFREAAYAAFLFDSGKCECCGSETSLMYSSFALRARLCRDNKCARPGNLTNLTNLRNVNIIEILPTNEGPISNQGTYTGDGLWPNVGRIFCRPEQMQTTGAEYLAKANDEDYKKKFKLLKERNQEWMEFCVKLYKWKQVRQEQYRLTKLANESASKKMASRYGWEYSDLGNTVYGAYERQKSKLIEKVNDVDVKVMQEEIESQLLALAGKRERRNAEIALMKNREDVEAVYKRLRSAKTHQYLPSLATFRHLPVVEMLQSAERPSHIHSVADTLQNDKVMKELLASQVKKWVEKAKVDLGVALGFPRNWKSASKNLLHPVERVTARFLCVRCESVETKYRVDGCLDFAGACMHECVVGNQKKGRLRKGKKALWDAKNFAKDEKAINVLRKSIEALGLAEDRDAGNYLLKVGLGVVCTTCEPDMVLDSRSLLGHSHRHDDMEISFASPENIASYLCGFPHHHGLVQKLLGPGSLSLAAKREIDRKNFGCRHCLREKQVKDAAAAAAASTSENAGCDANQPAEGPTAQNSAGAQPSLTGSGTFVGQIELSSAVYRMHDLGTEGPLERPPPLFSFNGMRSHLKSKHHIEDIRDEDIFCYRGPEITL